MQYDKLTFGARFLTIGPALYNNLREQYIPRKYWNRHTDINYVKLMTSDSYIVLNNLAVYITEAVKLRNEIHSVSVDVI